MPPMGVPWPPDWRYKGWVGTVKIDVTQTLRPTRPLQPQPFLSELEKWHHEEHDGAEAEAARCGETRT
eukprot:2352619-Prymnesium_polylepis.1